MPRVPRSSSFELEVGESVFLTAADVVELSPEVLGNVGLADVCKKAAGILNSCPLKHAVYRNMEHDGVDVLEDVGIKDTGLTKRYPMLKPDSAKMLSAMVLLIA